MRTLGFVIAVFCQLAAAAVAKQPNVIFILADDLGYGGLHCYGTEWLETPHIDSLCRDGMKFTNGYASHPTCQPSRIAILSGQYAPRTGGYRVMDHHRGQEHLIKYIVPKLTGLQLDKTSFAEQFKSAGYATAMFGKWHAGNYRKELHPRHHGFDEAHVCRGHYDDSRTDPPMKLPEGMDSGEYFTGEAITFMEKSVEKKQPFLLYMPYYLVHAPFETRQDYIDHFKTKLEGIEFADRNADRIPVYAAMTKHLDDCVGRLTDAVEKMGIEKETIIVFTSDNGSYCPDLAGGYRGQKGDVYEGGLRVPYIFKWVGKIEAGSRCEERITHVDLYPTFLELAGVKRPKDYPLDGKSLAPLLAGGSKTLPERSVVCYYPKYGQYNEKTRLWNKPWRNVIFNGDYKLREVVEYGTFELYNLKDDPLEQNDLSQSQPEKLQRLIGLLRRWEKEIGAPPLKRNPAYSLD